MSPSPYASENDTFPVSPEMIPLSDLMDIDELLPIEQDDFLRSCSSLGPYPDTSGSKTVTFGGIQSLDFIESSRDMTDQDVEDRWFTKAQLCEFKRTARTLCKEEHSGKDIGDDNSTRGMDVYFPARQKTHAKYIYHVMRAINVECKGNPEYVAQLCEKWSTKSRDRALVIAVEDFYHAYYPHIAQAKGISKTSQATTAIQRSNKRSAPTELRAPARTRSL